MSISIANEARERRFESIPHAAGRYAIGVSTLWGWVSRDPELQKLVVRPGGKLTRIDSAAFDEWVARKASAGAEA